MKPQLFTTGLVLVTLWGCGGDKETETGQSSTSTSTSTTPTQTGEGPEVSDISAEVSDAIGTVVRVRWSTDVPSNGHVEFGAGEAFDLSTPADASELSTDHEVLLLGLTGDTDAQFRIVASSESGTTVTSGEAVRTGSLPGWLPSLTQSGEGQEEYLTLPVLGASTGAVVIDPDGKFVWYHQDTRGLDVYRARLSRDGQSMVYNAASVSGDPADDSMLVRVSLFDGTETTTPVPLLAHDFVEMPDLSVVAITMEYRDDASDPDGEQIAGNQLVQVAADGSSQEVIWSAWDCYDPATTPGDEMGWTFANAIDYDPVDDAFYLSLSSMSSIVKIDRKTGDCLWALGGMVGTIDLAAGSNAFLREHQFQMLDDGIVVFDNDGPAGLASRVLEYSLDFDANLATEVWSYQTDPPIYNFVLGDVTRFDNGDTLIVWSVNGQIDRVNAAGEVLWQVNTGLGSALGFTVAEPSLYVGP
jgi:hypothetical protein